MTPIDRTRERWLLALVLIVALALRLVYVLSMEPEIFWFDGREYSRLAQGLLEGGAYTDIHGYPSAFWPPGYPFFLAGIYAVFGPSVTVVRVVQAFLGAVICALAYLIARRWLSRRAALLAAALAGIYPLHIYMVGTLFSTTLQTVLLGGATYLALRAVDRGGWGSALAGGFFAGWASLTAASILPAALCAVLWMIWEGSRPLGDASRTEAGRGGRRWARGLRLGALFLAPIVVVIAPWTIRNTQVFDRPVLISNNGGYNFWLGNYPGVTATTGNRMDADMRAEWQSILDAYRREAERDRAFYRRGLEHVAADPWGFVTRSLAKGVNLWRLYPAPMTETEHADTLGKWASIGSYGVLLPFAFVFLIASLPRRRETRLLLLICVAYTIVHALYISKVRLRLPVDTFVVVCAAGGISWVLGRWVPWWGGEEISDDLGA